MKRMLVPAGMILFAGACSGPPSPVADGNGASVGGGAAPIASPAPTHTAATPMPDQSAYLGRWIGVEGMYLDVTPNPAGGVRMAMQWDLDHKGRFVGAVGPDGLRFVRNGQAEVARRTDGDATGLKYLAGKTECLTVKPGEGYCRQ